MLQINNIKGITTTIKKLQVNAACEKLCQSASKNLHAILHHHFPHTLQKVNLNLDTWLASAVYAPKAAINPTLNISPDKH